MVTINTDVYSLQKCWSESEKKKKEGTKQWNMTVCKLTDAH